MSTLTQGTEAQTQPVPHSAWQTLRIHFSWSRGPGKATVPSWALQSLLYSPLKDGPRRRDTTAQAGFQLQSSRLSLSGMI